MRKSIAIVVLILLGMPAAARAGDAGDRMLGVDMNRDKAESRVDRLREDKQQVDRVHAEKPAPVTPRKKKPVQNPN